MEGASSEQASDEPTSDQAKSKQRPWFLDKIEALENENARLKSELATDTELRAQLAAKDQALGAKLGLTEDEIGPIPDVAWGLLWQEYFHRTGQFSFVALDGRRSKGDRNGNKWSIETLNNLSDNLDLVEKLGYDPETSRPDEFILLKCFPSAGAYSIAEDEIDRARQAYLLADKNRYQAAQAVQEAQERNRPDLAATADRELERHKVAAEEARTKFVQCKAVIDNAVQRYYMIPVEALENLWSYTMPIKCRTATVIPQKRHQNLPNYMPPSDPVVAAQEFQGVA
jgi:hypothetical protein